MLLKTPSDHFRSEVNRKDRLHTGTSNVPGNGKLSRNVGRLRIERSSNTHRMWPGGQIETHPVWVRECPIVLDKRELGVECKSIMTNIASQIDGGQVHGGSPSYGEIVIDGIGIPLYVKPEQLISVLQASLEECAARRNKGEQFTLFGVLDDLEASGRIDGKVADQMCFIATAIGLTKQKEL